MTRNTLLRLGTYKRKIQKLSQEQDILYKEARKLIGADKNRCLDDYLFDYLYNNGDLEELKRIEADEK